MHLGVVLTKHLSGADSIEHEQIASLAPQLLPSIIENLALPVAGFSGKTNQQRLRRAPIGAVLRAGWAPLHELGENVRIAGEHQHRIVLLRAFLDFRGG